MKVEGAGVLSDPDPDVVLDGYPAVQAVGDLEREDENETVVEGAGAILKNPRAKVRFEEKGKEPLQRPLSAKVGQGPGKVVL